MNASNLRNESHASRLATAARETMSAPRDWDGARSNRVYASATKARRARAQRKQQVGAVLSAVAAAAVFVLAVRSFGGNDASANAGAPARDEGAMTAHTSGDPAGLTYADGSAFSRDGDGGGLEASRQ